MLLRWLHSHNTVISRCIQFLQVTVLFQTEEDPTVCRHHVFFTHSSVVGHLSCFYNVTTVTSAAADTDVGCDDLVFFGSQHCFSEVF